MSNKYSLSTIKDIFDKVPAYKINKCCRELGELMTQSANLRDVLLGDLEMLGIKIPESGIMNMPDSIEWVDDSLGDLTWRVGTSDKGEFNELFSVETKVGDSHESEPSTVKP